MLEGALTTDPDPRRLIISEFDIRERRYTGRHMFYRMESSAHAIGDLTAVTKQLFLVIERDNFQGAPASFKKIFLVDLNDVDQEGFLVKREVADLLNIRDPYNLGGHGPDLSVPVPDHRERDSAQPQYDLACSTTTTTRSARVGPPGRPTRTSSSSCGSIRPWSA